MAEAQAANEKVSKPKTEVTMVKMEDGREVGFAGKRKMDKEYLIDDSKIQIGDDGSVFLAPGAVSVRIDFLNGKTINFVPPASLVAQGLGHGLVQKLGDEAADSKDVDDAHMAVEELANRLQSGEWRVAREAGDSFSGASIVVKAIVEHQQNQGKTTTVEQVKAFLQGKLDEAKAKGETLSRKALYDSFRDPRSKVGQIVKRLEEEKLSKGSAIDADAALAEMN